MSSVEKPQIPAVEGWLRMDEADPSLLGTRCEECRTVYFPPERTFCRNPRCAGSSFEEHPLSRRGRLWSFTNNCYPPPDPYVASDPFEPYAIAAVELEAEKMVVLGQVVSGVNVGDLKAGMEMELVLATLFEDDENEVVVWKWQPVAA
ncbi:OB-fold domain-containing protein [Myxococcota bacterium]|nr:OB-fold domain-containing protein [Myxococcota bacterium]